MAQQQQTTNKASANNAMHSMREAFDKEHDLSNLSAEEKCRMHDSYAKMGAAGGQKRAEELGSEGYRHMGHMGGVKRAEQMAKAEKNSENK